MGSVALNIEPNESGETFWLMISLLCLPVEEQIEIIGGLPDEGDELANDYERNPASFLLSTIYEYYNGWLDEFYPNCPCAEALYDAVNGGSEFLMTRDAYVNSDSWKRLRELARMALEESGLPLFPVPDKINFDKYIE